MFEGILGISKFHPPRLKFLHAQTFTLRRTLVAKRWLLHIYPSGHVEAVAQVGIIQLYGFYRHTKYELWDHGGFHTRLPFRVLKN